MAILQPTITNISVNNPQPILGQVLISSSVKNTTFYTSKILNHVESVEIEGVLKTVFYTEVNTNVNVGDRVFILNGNYDFDDYIGGEKYKKFSDGYRVLSVDGCKIVLDLNYSGLLPYNTFTTKDFIYVHHITSQKDFDYINSLKIIVGGQKPLKSVFGGNIDASRSLVLDCNNIVYASTPFSGSTNPENINDGIPSRGFTPGFWVRVENGSTYPWINVNLQIQSNSIIQNTDFSNSGNLYVVGDNFNFDGQDFVQRGIYEYKNFSWVFNTKYYQPFLSKVNFRNGKFRGTFNDGIFGTYLKRNIWTDSEWNSGAFVNSTWKDGIMNSKHTLDELSYSAVMKIVGSISTVLQSVDVTNNRGFGYNFVEDSSFEKFVLNNGNFKNCDFLGLGTNLKAIDNYYNTNKEFSNKLNGGKFELCDIKDIKSSGGYILNSSVKNSNLTKSKLVSSEYQDSTLTNGFWSNEGGIKIIGADIWSYEINEGSIIGTTNSNIQGILKLYISEEDYFKLSYGDTFYINRINKDIIFNQLSEDQKINYKLENRFLIDNYLDFGVIPSGKNFRVSLKSTNENKYKTFVKHSANQTSIFSESIDDTTPGFWLKIPPLSTNSTQPANRGLYNSTDEDLGNYKLGDYVFYVDNNLPIFYFYLYWPIDNNPFSPTYGSRARNTSEVNNFRVNGPLQTTGNGLVDNGPYKSHWFKVGEFKGIWATGSSYQGTTIPQSVPTDPYSPARPSGDIVGNKNDIIQSTQFWIFVGSPATNKIKQTLISTNYFTENDIQMTSFNYPSIDISTDALGYYLDNNNVSLANVVYTSKYDFLPITTKNVNDVFVNNIIGNGDLKSGLFENSTWLSGDNQNYSGNEIGIGSFIQQTTPPLPANTNNSIPNTYRIILNINTQTNKRNLSVRLKTQRLSSIYKFEGYDIKIGDYVWLSSLDYLKSGQVFKVDGRYKVIQTTGTTFFNVILESDQVGNDPLDGLQTGGTFRSSIGMTNNYFSLGKVIFKNSKIVSGKFRKTLFEGCTFENDLFQKYISPTKDVINTERLRLINILFGRTNNTLKSGIVYKSHFSDNIFDGATFYDSFWYGGQFKDGLFKFSTWFGGTFDGGKFVDARDTKLYKFDYDYSREFKLWKGGEFNGGEFFNSLWVTGTFNGGRFYNSDWTGGIWNNGILGSNQYRSNETTLGYYGPSTSFGATFTIWNNGVVENALVGGYGSLDWYNGKMLGGVFSSFGRSSTNHSIWHNGDFFGSTFEKQSWWKNGKFYSGKFLSEIGWDKVDFLTHSNDEFDYGWVSGEFYSGEFGSGSASAPNATWYDGLFYDGTFIGKFWKNGLMIDGNFFGNFENTGDVSESLLNNKTNFYGLWNDGNVNDVLYEVKKDIIVSNTNQKLRSRNKAGRVNFGPIFEKVVWRSGTFSHFDGNFNNSVWLNGNFMSGNFNNSVFNPFVDLTLSGITTSDYKRSRFFQLMKNEIENLVSNQPQQNIFLAINNIVQKYDGISDYDLELVVDFYIDNFSSTQIPDSDIPSLFFGQAIGDVDPTINSDTTTIMRIYERRINEKDYKKFLAINLYYSNGVYTYSIYYDTINLTKINLSFEEKDTCVWTNGNFNGGEFNYSKWLSGNFNDGTMNGAIWIDGTFNYGSMYNCYWESGIWRNGNWYGAPFDSTALLDNGSTMNVTDKRVDDIIQNIINYTTSINNQNPYIYLSNVIIQQSSELPIHTFRANNNFSSWTFSVDD